MRAYRFGLAVLAAGCLLVACEPAPPPDPLADAVAACADPAAAPAPRIAACTAVIESGRAQDEVRAGALAGRGEAYRASGDPTAALRDFAAALTLRPQHMDAKLGRAAVLLASGQLDAAAPVIESVLERPGAPARAHALRADLYARSGDRLAALAEYDQALIVAPRNADWLAARGLVKQAGGDFAAARLDLDAALALAPDNAPARAGRCWNRIQAGADLPDARRDAEAAIAADPALVDGQLCLGLVLLRQQQWPEARAAYDVVLRIEPANAAALFGRGYARRESGERREGAEDIRRAYAFNSRIDLDFRRFGVEL